MRFYLLVDVLNFNSILYCNEAHFVQAIYWIIWWLTRDFLFNGFYHNLVDILYCHWCVHSKIDLVAEVFWLLFSSVNTNILVLLLFLSKRSLFATFDLVLNSDNDNFWNSYLMSQNFCFHLVHLYVSLGDFLFHSHY